ncbi:MAG: hypothetical protein V4577_13595 [Bacteroidota bacterium]
MIPPISHDDYQTHSNSSALKPIFQAIDKNRDLISSVMVISRDNIHR